MIGFRCMPTISDKICNFDIVKPPQGEFLLPSIDKSEEILKPVSLAVPNVTHSVCNMKSGKCDECKPSSSGMGCVSTDKCNATCKKHDPKDYFYECDWQNYKCGQFENGTFSSQECKNRCTKAAFGKCDFKT